MKDSKIYYYEYYKNSDNLQVKMLHRLNAAHEIDYLFEKDNKSKIIYNKMLKISSLYGNLGFKVNNEINTNSSYNKKYRIEFYPIEELEKTTLENIIWNDNLQTPNINMSMVNARYKLLSVNDVQNLQEENEKLLNLINLKTQTIRRSYGIDDVRLTYTV